ncbi:MAG: hypothetical protein U5R31_00720 [Acidimicrobiia bacterium]|nr:hypothetical protein [Acidimicrobiia bacterium]
MATEPLRQARTSFPNTFRSEDGAIFGFEQPAPEGATERDRMAAFLGRKV